MPDSPGEAARFLTRNAVEALPEGELERQLEQDRPAAREARRGPHHARHPPRSHGRAAQAARVPGPRPHGRADHRRLHRARGRPERPLLGAARRRPRGDRPQRRDLPGAGLQGARPRAHRGAPQRRVARHADGGPVPARAHVHRGPDPRARRLRQALLRPAARSRSSSCSTRCSRATTRWPCARTWSSAAPTRSSTSCSRATSSRPTGCAPQSVLTMPILPGHRRRAEDVQVARELRGRGRAARRGVRQAHAASRTPPCRSTTTC